MILLILIFVIGIGVSIFAYLSIQNQQALQQETKQIIVLNRDVSPYETIGQNDLTTKDILKSYETTGILTDRYDFIGKISADYLVADEPIREELIIDKSNIKHVKFVTLKTDYTRSGGAKMGDIVDVYKVTEATRDTPSEVALVGENAIVINVTDSSGRSTIENNENKSLTAPLGVTSVKVPIQALKLAVDSRAVDVKKIVEGSVDGNQYVMVVKNTERDKFVLGGK